jgi:membrane protein insertase Oxa1/YidC/SpoIIIJ
MLRGARRDFRCVAILVYWLSDNAWTLAQHHFLARLLDRERAASP